MTTLSYTDKEIIRVMANPLYTVEFCEEWVQRKSENVFTNAPAALQQCCVEGFVTAVKDFSKLLESKKLTSQLLNKEEN